MKIVLPKKDEKGKGLYSYSQHKKWWDSSGPKGYIRSYFFGEKFDGNTHTKFGNKVGKALEKNDYFWFDKEEIKTLKKVTRLQEFERPISFDFGDFTLIGYIDTNDLFVNFNAIKKSNSHHVIVEIIDYKTGALDKVDLYESKDYDQLVIYAAAIEQETGKLPEKASVELIEKLGNGWTEPLSVGKKVVKIDQDISPARVKRVVAKVLTGAKQVSAHYKVFNKLNEIMV